MHELVIVGGIIEAVSQIAEKENRAVRSFTISIGELANYDKDIIEELLREMIKSTTLEGSDVDIVIERAEVECRSCNSRWGFSDLVKPLSSEDREMIHFLPELISSFTGCPDCGSRDLEIKSGRGIRVTHIELE